MSNIPDMEAALADMAREMTSAQNLADEIQRAAQGGSPPVIRGSGPSPSPPPVRQPQGGRGARGSRDGSHKSHWLLLIGILVGVSVSNAVHYVPTNDGSLDGSVGARSLPNPFPGLSSFASYVNPLGVRDPEAKTVGQPHDSYPGLGFKSTDTSGKSSQQIVLDADSKAIKKNAKKGFSDSVEKMFPTVVTCALLCLIFPMRKWHLGWFLCGTVLVITLALTSNVALRTALETQEFRMKDVLFKSFSGKMNYKVTTDKKRTTFDVSSFTFGKVFGHIEGDGRELAGVGHDMPDIHAYGLSVIKKETNSFKRWRDGKNFQTKMSRAADLLGLTNCPRIRIVRDLLIGNGAVANLVGVGEFQEGWTKDSVGVKAESTQSAKSLKTSIKVLPLLLFLTCPGCVLTLRSHELWGLENGGGFTGVFFGFALTAMWCQGALELYSRWRDCPKRLRLRRVRARERLRNNPADATSMPTTFQVFKSIAMELFYTIRDFNKTAAFRIWISRGVYPGIARAVMLELLGLILSVTRFKYFPHPIAEGLRKFVLVLGGVFLPGFRVVYRAWYVTSTARGSRRWLDIQQEIHARRGREFDPAWGFGFGEADTRNVPPTALERLDAQRNVLLDSDDERDDDANVDQGVAFDRNFAIDETGVFENTRDRANSLVRIRRASLDVLADETTRVATTVTMVNNTGTNTNRANSQGQVRNGSGNGSSSSHGSSHSPHWPAPVQIPDWLDEETAPLHFKCPITLSVIREPAVTPAGISYERTALMQWLEHQHTEPSTKRRLKRSRVVPNLTLRGMIEDWLTDQRNERRVKQLKKAERAFRLEEQSKQCLGNKGVSETGIGSGASATGSIDASTDPLLTHFATGAASRLHRPGLPRTAAHVSQETRDELRQARQRMYAALKRRSASGVSAEEQRWADFSARRVKLVLGGGSGSVTQGFSTGSASTSVPAAGPELEDDASVFDTTVPDADDVDERSVSEGFQTAVLTSLEDDTNEDPYL